MTIVLAPLTGITFGVYRRLQSGAWIPVSRRFQTHDQAESYLHELPRDRVHEVREIALMEGK